MMINISHAKSSPKDILHKHHNLLTLIRKNQAAIRDDEAGPKNKSM